MKYGKWWGVKEWYATAMYFRAGRLGRMWVGYEGQTQKQGYGFGSPGVMGWSWPD